MNRWFETNASRLGAKHFDMRYGSGAPGYDKNPDDYFNKSIFNKGGWDGTYTNPRTGYVYQREHPIHGAKSTIWDFIL